MKYPASFTKTEGGFVIGFRDIPEALTQGETYEEAVSMAEDSLLTALDFYFEDNRFVPMPSPAEKDDILIDLPASAFTKVLLLNAILEARITQSDLAKRMNITPQQVTRLVNLKHTTKIDNIACAFKALGKELCISIR